MQGCDGFILGFDDKGLPADLGADAAPLHFRHLGADVNLRYPLHTLLREGPVVDAGAMPCLLQSPIGLHLPRFAPVLQKRFVVPAAVFWAETVRPNVAHGEQDVSVRIAALGVMNGNVRHHARLYELASGETADERALLV